MILLRAILLLLLLAYPPLAQEVVVNPPSAPALWNGLYNVATSGGCTQGAGQTLAVRQATATCIQKASDYCATNGVICYLPGGTYEIDVAAGITWSDTTKYNGFRWLGSKNSIIEQFHANAPILTVGDVSSNGSLIVGSMAIDGLQISYGVSQTGDTAADALVLGNIEFCSFANIKVGTSILVNPPWISVRFFTASGGSFFSNSMRDMEIWGAQQSMWSFEIGGTGNNFFNIYMTSDTGTGNDAGTTTLPFNISPAQALTEQHYDRLNIEWVQSTGGNSIMTIQGTEVKFTAFHAEGWLATTVGPTLIETVGSFVQFDNPSFYDIGLNTADTTAPVLLFGSFGAGAVTLQNPYFSEPGPTVALNVPLTIFGSDGPTPPTFQRSAMTITNLAADPSFDGFLQVDATLPVATYGTVRQISGYDGPTIYPMAKTAVIADPATGYILPGCFGQETTVFFDKVIAATTTIVLGPNYMLGSDKGSTIKIPVGHQVRVVRDSGATGAFNIIIKDSTAGGSTIGTFTGTGSAGTTQTFGWNGTAWAAI